MGFGVLNGRGAPGGGVCVVLVLAAGIVAGCGGISTHPKTNSDYATALQRLCKPFETTGFKRTHHALLSSVDINTTTAEANLIDLHDLDLYMPVYRKIVGIAVPHGDPTAVEARGYVVDLIRDDHTIAVGIKTGNSGAVDTAVFGSKASLNTAEVIASAGVQNIWLEADLDFKLIGAKACSGN